MSKIGKLGGRKLMIGGCLELGVVVYRGGPSANLMAKEHGGGKGQKCSKIRLW